MRLCMGGVHWHGSTAYSFRRSWLMPSFGARSGFCCTSGQVNGLVQWLGSSPSFCLKLSFASIDSPIALICNEDYRKHLAKVTHSCRRHTKEFGQYREE